jgi:hypothetical protein
MYIDEDDNSFYDSSYIYELEPQNYPLECPYRQIVPSSPFSQGPHSGPPSAPPSFTPPLPQTQQHGISPLAIDQGAIRPCIFRFVYIWPRRGRGFWAWLTFVGPRSLAGFRWNRNNWRYFGMDLRNISSFQCF